MRTNPIVTAFAIIASALLMSACATNPDGAVMASEHGATPTRLLKATGYGTAIRDNAQFSIGQQKLMAIRAAKVDAYRILAEQLYGLRVRGSTAAGNFTTQNDTLRTYVEGFVQGARVTDMKTLTDGNVQVSMELDVPAGFIARMAEKESAASMPAVAGSCSGRNCMPEVKN